MSGRPLTRRKEKACVDFNALIGAFVIYEQHIFVGRKPVREDRFMTLQICSIGFNALKILSLTIFMFFATSL